MALDLTEATEVAARAFYEHYESDGGKRTLFDTWADLNARADGHKDPGYMDQEIRDDTLAQAQAALTAAAPLIEAQVREQIAREIEAKRRTIAASIAESPMPDGSTAAATDMGVLHGLATASDIARGAS